MHQGFCNIVPLDRYNWELCLNIKISPIQEEFVPPVLYSLAQSKFENLNPFGIIYGEEMVGFIMYGEFGGICWLNRIMVDESYQRMGIGRSSVRMMLEMMRKNIRCKEIRTTYSSRNEAAALFFAALGFEVMDTLPDGEVIAVYQES